MQTGQTHMWDKRYRGERRGLHFWVQRQGTELAINFFKSRTRNYCLRSAHQLRGPVVGCYYKRAEHSNVHGKLLGPVVGTSTFHGLKVDVNLFRYSTRRQDRCVIRLGGILINFIIN